MTTLHLGVIDIPYSEPPRTGKRPSKGDHARSTGDVAGYLENKYHIMEHFYELHADDIAGYLTNSLAGSLETMLMTNQPPVLDFNASAMQQIEKRFRDFLSLKELNGLGYPGIPTKASLKGFSSRFKGKRGAAGRPSFIDTGLYQKSFKAWIGNG